MNNFFVTLKFIVIIIIKKDLFVKISLEALVDILPSSEGSLKCSLGRKGEGRPPILLTYETSTYQTRISASNKEASKWEW